MKLRDYQSECLDAVALAAMQGCNRQLVVLPTAGGKTIIFAHLPERLRIRRPDKMLVLVQSDEIAFQSVDKLHACNPSLKIGLEKAQYKSTWSDDIVIASVQSLQGSKIINENGDWEWSKRLLNMDRDGFRYVVVDETHHIAAVSYHSVLRYFKVLKSEPQFNDPTRFLLGVTATPDRADNQGLEAFYDKIVFSRDIRAMIRDGWLATPEAHRIKTMVNIDDVGMRRGELITSQLENAINTPERNNLVVDKYLELGENAPFLAFTCDIQHTLDLTECFRARGIGAFGIASRSDKDSPWLITKEAERKETIAKYNNGDFPGLVSCAALLEGFDAPRAMVGLDATPTGSRLRFTQKFGRVLRPYPAPEAAGAWPADKWRKRCAIWMDFIDSTSRHSLMSVPSLFGLRPDFDPKGKSVVEAVEEIERLKTSKPALNANLYTNLDAIRAVAERIDLFAVPSVPATIAPLTPFAWTMGVGDGVYVLKLPGERGDTLSIRVNALGEHEIARHVYGVQTPLGSAKTLAEALRMAERHVPQEAMVVLRSDAKWRRLPPSDNQIWAIRGLYPEIRRSFRSDEEFHAGICSKYSRGEASALITARAERLKQGARR